MKWNRKVFATLMIFLSAQNAFAQGQEPSYRYENGVEASDLARDWFGTQGNINRTPGVDVGNFSAGISTRLDCGRLDINANIKGQLKNVEKQVRELIPQNMADARRLVSQSLMVTFSYAYPTLAAQLRHDFLALQGNLNLRAQACQAIDKYIDNQADKGAMQLRAEAQAECVSKKIQSGGDTAQATADCQDVSGLPLRDFQAGLEKKFKSGKQTVLSAVVDFARQSQHYEVLASLLGEIEVQQDGYWQPLFSKGMLHPDDAARNFLSEGQSAACGNIGQWIAGRNRNSGPYAPFVQDVVSRKLSAVDVQHLGDLSAQDKNLACVALGSAIGKEAAARAGARYEAIMASGLLNSSIPSALREEYRSRAASAFPALRAAIDAEDIPSLDEVRKAVSDLAALTREKNRLLAARMSEGRIHNMRDDIKRQTDCVDTLSCEGR